MKKIESMLYLGMVGDALGVPLEMKTPQEIQVILASKNNGELASKYLKAKLSTLLASYGFDQDRIGMISDDTLLSNATILSLTEKGGFDYDDMMQKHLDIFESYPYGFGRNTKTALAKFKSGVLPLLCGEQDREKPKIGNGVLMKQAALAAWEANEEQVVNFTKLTHNHPITIIASLIHHQVLTYLLGTNEFKAQDLFDICENTLLQNSDAYGLNPAEVKRFTDVFTKLHTDFISGKLQKFSLEEIFDAYCIREKTIFSSGNVFATLGICYAMLLRNQDFYAVIEAANVGGDTDTYAAIVGNLIGALTGKMPDAYYLENIENIQELQKVVNNFVRVLANKK